MLLFIIFHQKFLFPFFIFKIMLFPEEIFSTTRLIETFFNPSLLTLFLIIPSYYYYDKASTSFNRNRISDIPSRTIIILYYSTLCDLLLFFSFCFKLSELIILYTLKSAFISILIIKTMISCLLCLDKKKLILIYYNIKKEAVGYE